MYLMHINKELVISPETREQMVKDCFYWLLAQYLNESLQNRDKKTDFLGSFPKKLSEALRNQLDAKLFSQLLNK